MEVIIQHEEDSKKGMFYIGLPSSPDAEMTYIYAGSQKIIINHTGVRPHLQGQNIGYKLLDSLVEYTKESNIKIVPLCPFAKAAFSKNTALQDLLT